MKIFLKFLTAENCHRLVCCQKKIFISFFIFQLTRERDEFVCMEVNVCARSIAMEEEEAKLFKD